ncbi:MAG TPA: non-homologous end-joining DNA ligase, partial [Fimbriimonadaceae bacterium]|nr:non-homologous end-joining DNA ligase [Fimbriimonadaceae bacterium]
GSWTLVKTHSKEADQWLMIKHRDGAEREDFDVTTLDRSVKTGRTVDDVRTGRAGSLIRPADVTGAVERKQMPEILSPMAAVEAKEPFNKKGWAFELKIDGIRILAHVEHGNVRLYSRNGNDVTAKFPKLVEELKQLPYERFILDGEAVCYEDDGTPSFQNMLQRFQLQDARQIASMDAKLPIEYCIFDLLYLDGWDLRGARLEDRRSLLEQMNPRTTTMRVLDSFPEDGTLLFEHATQIGFEGVVGKKLDSRYREGVRSPDWLKIKKHHSDEFFVAGWTPGQGNRSHAFGALILAEKDENGAFRYAGNVGSGFNDATLDQTAELLKALPKVRKPFAQSVENESKAHWVEPRLVAEVRYAQRTKEGYLRFPVFLRLRPEWDIDPNVEVKEDMPGTAEQSGVESVVDQLQNPKDEFPIEVEGQRIGITSASKVLWPATEEHPAVTKREFLIYLAKVADAMIPHLRDRPIAFARFPDGLKGGSFFQKHWAHRPDFVNRVDIWSNHVGSATEYLLCNNLPTLLWLGQLAALEIHPWYSRIEPKPDTDLPTNFAESDDTLDESVLNYPDFMVIDLDPNIRTGNEKEGEDPEPSRFAWEKTIEAALPLKELLDGIGLRGYPKTSGKTGLHVYVPIKRVYDYKTVRLMCETIGRHLLEQIPEVLTMEWKVSKRPAKIFFDHNQNVRGKTLVSVYSPRPVPGAPVSFPVSWDELERGIYPADFRIDNVPEILKERGDAWADILASRQSIGAT